MSSLSRLQVECPSCHATIQACLVGIGRRLPCPHCGQPVLVKAGAAAQPAARPGGMDARSPDMPMTPARSPSRAWTDLVTVILVGGGGVGWWYLSRLGTLPDLSAWRMPMMAGGVLLLAAAFLISARAVGTLLKVAVPLCCVGFVAWKLLGPAGVLGVGPLRLPADSPAGAAHAISAAPPILLEFLPDANASGDEAAFMATPSTAVAHGAAPVTFMLEGVAGVDVGATVRKSLSAASPGLRPSWSITTHGSTAMVKLWMGGDFERVAQTLPVGRERSRDAAARRIVIEVDPARCVRRR